MASNMSLTTLNGVKIYNLSAGKQMVRGAAPDRAVAAAAGLPAARAPRRGGMALQGAAARCSRKWTSSGLN